MAKRKQRIGSFIEFPEFSAQLRAIRLTFVNNLPVFTLFDSNLNNTYAADWLTAIEAFENHESDFVLRADVTSETENQTAKRAAAIQLMLKVEYYVKMAFPRDERKLKEFGLLAVSTLEHRMSALEFVVNGFVLVEVMNDYLTELTAVGMDPNLLMDADVAMSDIAGSELNQEYSRRLRLRASDKRIDLYNALFAIYTKVRAAANVIFVNEPEVSAMFSLREKKQPELKG